MNCISTEDKNTFIIFVNVTYYNSSMMLIGEPTLESESLCIKSKCQPIWIEQQKLHFDS